MTIDNRLCSGGLPVADLPGSNFSSIFHWAILKSEGYEVVVIPQVANIAHSFYHFSSFKTASKKAGSNNRKRARRSLALLHRKVANRRKEFHWKLALDLARRYDNLYFEDLNLKAMQRLYGRKIGDLGFANFLNILETVCAKRGKTVGYIGRFEPSSKTCSCCGHVVKELPLSVREWSCPSCGANHDRDLNAAKNIYRVGASAHGLGDVNPALPQVVAA